MSSRVEKRRSKKTDERSALFAVIEHNGSDIMPCTYCFKNNLRCRIFGAASDKCSNCVKRGRPCDGNFVASSLTRLLSEQKRLEQSEEEAAKALQDAQREASIQLARLDRIRIQKRSLVTRSAELVRRGVQSLDELEEIERQESEAVFLAQSHCATDVIDWNMLGLSSVDALLGVPLDSGGVGFSGGTAEQGVGSSSSS